MIRMQLRTPSLMMWLTFGKMVTITMKTIDKTYYEIDDDEDDDENTGGVEVDCASLAELWRADRVVCPSGSASVKK